MLLSAQHLFYPDEKPAIADPIIKINNQTIGTLGNVVTISGRSGVRKSTYLHAFIGSYITHQRVFNLQVEAPKERKKIILLDTEQSAYSLYNQFKRLKKQLQIKKINDDLLQIYRLRQLSEEDIKKFVYNILEENPDCFMLCIDNVLDMVLNYNDVAEAKRLMDIFKGITDYYKILLFALIHQSKQTEFSIGHAGSRLEALAQTSLRVQFAPINKTDNNKEISQLVVGEKIRDSAGFDPIEITYDKKRGHYIEI
jgi:KaiC/GvpD/RAD55 family RecA-like ATPase